MRFLRDRRGQASLEYAGLLALVAVVVGGAASAVAAPWLPAKVAGAIRHGICLVSGSVCTADEARRAGLAPCPVAVRTSGERAGVSVLAVRLDRDDVLLVERRSDGTVAVSFADGWRAGAGLGVSFGVPGGPSAEEGADAGVSFTAGRTYELPDWPAAQRFLARFARQEELHGEGRAALGKLCWHCAEMLGAGGAALPPASATYREGGLWAEAEAEGELPISLGRGTVPLGVSGSSGAAAVLGRRTEGARETTYVRVGESAVAHAGVLLASLDLRRDAEVVLELTRERGQLVEARVRAADDVGAEASLPGHAVDLADAAAWVRAARRDREASGGDAAGLRLDVGVALDLTDPANRSAVLGILRPGASPLEWDDRVRAFGRRLDVAGAVDLHLSRTTASDDDESLEFLRVGGSYAKYEATRELVGAWSRRPGTGLQPREDCEAVTTGARAAA